ncbi:MAG: hypothetical protein A2W35_04015 [Chloroflexi bacterium RBG_16_57_11]|nr:MAG: hypothetical protein A2W35_04015 [Chloroflexi bacterium RBG_16_57_11]
MTAIANINRHIRLENVFAVIALTFGILFAVFTPPNEVPDENRHFARVYGDITGNFVSPNVTIPASFVEMLSEYHFRQQVHTINYVTFLAGYADRDDHVEQSVQLAAMYSPILYLPQLAGVALGMLVRVNDRWLFLLGRIAGMIIYVFTCYFILKTTPVAKRSLFVLFSMPMAVFLAASYSADMMQIVLSFLYLHRIVIGIKSSNKITRKEWSVFLLLSILLALTKPVSVLLPLLSLAIPEARFRSKRNKIQFIVSQFVGMIVFSLALWVVTTSAGNGLVKTGMNVKPFEQLLYILLNPLATIVLIFNSINQYGQFYINSFIGWFGWLTAPMPDFVYFLFLIGLSLAILGDMQNRFALTKGQKIIFLSVFLLYIVGMMISMYIYWTPPANSIIEGVQGRYFIPIVPLLLYHAASLRRPEWGRLDRLFTGSVSVIVPVVLAFSFQTIYLKYFVGCGENYYSVTSETCVRPLGLQTDKPEKKVGKLDRPFTQTFIAECNNLSEIAFFLAPYWGNDVGYLDIQLRDLAAETVVFQKKTFAPKTNGKWKEFSFPPLSDSSNRQYSLTIAPDEDAISGATLGFISADVYPQGELLGSYLPGDLVFKYTCRTGFLYDLRKIGR